MGGAEFGCWCGGALGEVAAPAYRRCRGCGSLVLAVRPGSEHFDVTDDERDFYGRRYWTDYAAARNFPMIGERARSDLSERCAFWLERLLQVVGPPGRVLELGCGHGGFVRLLQELGFTAMGTELSPWVVEFAQRTFDVPVLLGRLETLVLEPGFRCIAAFDVLEHLSDPLDTMGRCRKLLAEDGVLLLQTPCYRGEGPEWPMFQPDEHIHLFTERSARQLLERAGFESVAIRDSFFPHDMWIVARAGGGGAVPVPGRPPARIPAAFQAMLDLRRQLAELGRTVAAIDTDRAARLAQIETLTGQLEVSEADRAARLAQVETLTGQLEVSEADRAAHLAQIEGLTRQLAVSEADRAARLAQIETLTRQLAVSEADSAAHLPQIETLTRQLAVSEADRAAHLPQIETLTRQLAVSEADRAAHLPQIETLTRQLAVSEADRAAHLAQIEAFTRQLTARGAVIEELQAELDAIRRTRVWRLYRALRFERRAQPGAHS